MGMASGCVWNGSTNSSVGARPMRTCLGMVPFRNVSLVNRASSKVVSGHWSSDNLKRFFSLDVEENYIIVHNQE